VGHSNRQVDERQVGMNNVDIQTLPEAELLIAEVIKRVLKMKHMPDSQLLTDRFSDFAVVYSQLREIQDVLSATNSTHNK